MKRRTYMAPFHIDIDLIEGVLDRPDRHVPRAASVMRGYYADAAALDRLIAEQNDPLHYETFEKDIPEKAGQLCFCISQLQPGRVGDEFFMTKGHYHVVAATAEVYLCLRGQGLMLMKTPPDAEGHSRCAAEPMQRNRLVYVPPCWAHRSINTGNEPLVSLCVWPGNAGHNYGDIADQGFPQRAFLRDGQVVLVP
jgi:glucose-6-phosphate isomerase, archaeal